MSETQKGNRQDPRQFRLRALGGRVALAVAIGAIGMPSAGLAASNEELLKKIEDLQREMDALKAQVKTQAAKTDEAAKAAQAASTAATGKGPSWPAGFEFSIYGVGHISADHIDIDVPAVIGTDTSSGYVHSNSSRLGFRGSYDFGGILGGTAAIFQYEWGVELTGRGSGDGNGGCSDGGGDNSCGGQLFTRTRDAFVGLKGNWGQVVFGRLGGLNQWVYDYNLFADQVGDLGNIWGGTGLPGRVDHVIQYATPNFGGFTGALTYTPDQGTNDTDAWVAKVDFGMSGFKVGGAYASFGQDAPLGIPLSDWKVGAITASYSNSVFSVGGGWQDESNVAGLSIADRTSYTIGASINTGTFGAFKIQYAWADDIDPVPDSGGDQWAVGYDYNLFKNTTIYIAYAKTNNDTFAPLYTSYNYGHGDQGVPAMAFGVGTNPSALSVGLVYKFDANWGGAPR
jgi:predicted porin